MTSFARSIRVGAVALAASLAVAACGSSDDTGSAALPSVETSQAPQDDATPAALVEVSDSLAIDGAPLPEYPNTSADPAVGEVAPVITGQTFDGSDITIGGPTDGPTMLVFLAHWCPHCNDEIPEIVSLRDGGELPDDLNIIGISTAVVEDRDNYPPSEWVDDKDWTWPVLADTAEAEAFVTYGGTGFPFAVILNENGDVAARKTGGGSADQIKTFIEAALNV